MKKEKKIAIMLIVSGTLLLNVKEVLAQIDTSQVLVLPEVVITATRSEENPLNVGRSVTVISSEQIKKSGATSVAEVLSSKEGIYIVGTGQNPGQLQNIFMRGANSNQVTIMIDGVRITDPSSTDNAIDLSELSLIDINRIEIVRGSHSTLFGSSAIGGVINIITNKYKSPGAHAAMQISSGTFGPRTSAFSENLALNYTLKNGLYAAAEIYNTNTNGLDATVDTTTRDSYGHSHRDRDNFRKLDMIGKLGYRSEKLDIYTSYKSVHQQADIDKGAFTDDPNYIINLRRKLVTYGVNYRINNKFIINYTGGLTHLKRIARDDSSLVDYSGLYDHQFFQGTYKGSTSTNEIQLNYKTKGINLVVGGTYFNERMTFDTYYFSSAFGNYESRQNMDSLNISVSTESFFMHGNFDGSIINKKYEALAIGLGIRNSHHSLFGNNVTYEINPTLKINNNGLLFASWSTGFNAPSLYQLYSPDKDPSSGITRGNKTLKPETSSSFEVGFKQKVNDHISYSISYFNTVVENSIDYVYLWDMTKPIDSLSYLQYRGDTYLNIGKQTNQGFEVSFFSRISSKLYFSANASLISGKLDYNPSNIENIHTQGNHVQLFSNGAFINKEIHSIGLVRRPSTTNLTITYKATEKLSIGTNIRYVGSRNDIYYNSSLGPFGALGNKGMSDYTVVDLINNYQIRKGMSASLRVANIFDVKYYEIYGYTTRRRGFYLSLHYSF